MAKNQETTKNTIYTYLKSNGFDPQLKTTGNDDVDVMDKTDVIQFQFKLDDVNYGTASLSLDNEGVLKIYNSDKIANSPKQSKHGGKTWNQVIQDLRQMTFGKVKSFELDDMDNLGYDMAKRDHLKKIEEGYYPMGKKASYSDNVPECKIIIKHNRNIEEGEQRYRNIHQIFIENVMGERFLAPTTKPGLARVYARHIAEGGKVNDERWNHINSLCEEYSKMAGFVRATRNNQFNEDTQRLVEAGVNHYMSLRESLHKLAGKRGYNTYFESWSAPLMEGEGDEDLSEMFVNSSLDPRIESVIPILNRLNKNISENQEIKQVTELEEWADSVSEGGFEPHTAKFGKRILGHGKDWDEPMGHANIEIKINDRTWKIFPGAGPEGSQEWFDQKQKMRQMCKRKTESTGKEWKMYITGARPTAEGVAEGDVVAFKRPVSQPKTNQQPQNYHAALELASDWFWLEQGPMAHEMGTAKERKMQRLAAQKLVALKKLGYSVDWPLDDDDFYGVDLTYTPTKQTWRIDADNLGESMQGVAEMDIQQPNGRIKSDGTRSHSTYGSRDGHNITGPESTGKATTPKKVIKKGTDILDRAFKDADKKGVAEAEFEPHTAKFGKQVLGHGKDWDENPVGPAKWYKVYVSDGKEWSKKAIFDHEMAAQRFIHQQVLAQNPNARVGIVDYTMKPGSQPRIVKGMNEQDPNDPNWSQKYSKDVHENTDYATQVNSLLNEMGAGSIASAPGIMTNPAKTGSLFGGSYTQKNSPFKKKSTKKESMIKRDGL